MNAPGGELQMSACSIMQRASSTEDETCWASAGSCSSTSMKVNLYLGQGFQASTCSASRAAWSPDDLNAPPKFRPSAAAPEPSQYHTCHRISGRLLRSSLGFGPFQGL